jgi:4-diphosphocytidyl-2-C-methyl-D-erythritol kinase
LIEEISSVVLKAPAKINLRLKIVGKRTDGYHEIESLFAPLGLYDEISISHKDKGAKESDVTYSIPNGPPLFFENDTVTRALRGLTKANVPVPPLSIKVTKAIPIGGGLGGGSSDAGVLLSYLFDRFAPEDLVQKREQTLTKLALEIGADVPFFLRKGPALVWGIGEKLKSVKIDPLPVVVIAPPFSLSTKEVYGWFDQESPLTPTFPNVTTTLINGVGSGFLNLPDVLQMIENDLEKPVITRHPEITFLKKALRDRGALVSLMSGSGSSVYGVFKSLSEASTARENLQHNFPSNYAFFTCETLV